MGWPLHSGVVRFAAQHNFMKKLLKPMVYNKTQSSVRPVFCFSPEDMVGCSSPVVVVVIVVFPPFFSIFFPCI